LGGLGGQLEDLLGAEAGDLTGGQCRCVVHRG
jgi:hypothetical protein